MDASVEPFKARRLYLLLRDRIASGALAPGERLPGEPRLSAQHGVSRATLRRALDQLAADGVIERRAGSGTYVRAGGIVPPLRADFADTFAHLRAMGRRTAVRLLAFGYTVPPDDAARALGLAPGERAQRSVRVRLIDGAAFSFLTAYVPEHIGRLYGEADLASVPLLELLERSGTVAVRASQTIAATLAGPDVAAALGVEIGAPLLALTRIVRDRAGRGVEHLHALYRPDRFSFQMELRRGGTAGHRRWRPDAAVIPESSVTPAQTGASA